MKLSNSYFSSTGFVASQIGNITDNEKESQISHFHVLIFVSTHIVLTNPVNSAYIVLKVCTFEAVLRLIHLRNHIIESCI